VSITDSLKLKATRSIKWTVLIEIVSRTIQPIVFLILARLLSPDDFGLASAATVVINFSQLFWDAGLGKALIQTKENLDQAANVVFWTNAVLGVTIYIILYFSAPFIALFFHSNGFEPVLRVVGLQVIIQPLYAVQQALLMRNLDFKKLFTIKLSTAFAPCLFSIPMALTGFGVWALVAGTLVGSTANLVLFWNMSTWRPNWGINLALFKRLYNFGVWVLGESLVAWFMNWGDNLIVGHFLGIQSLGVYSIAWNICTLIYGLLLNPFLTLLYPTFSRLQDDRQSLLSAIQQANKIIISLSLPVGVGLLLVAPQFTAIFFGDKWPGLGLVLSLIGFLLSISWIFSINPEVFRAIGRPEINTKLIIFFFLIYFPAFLISAQFDLAVFSYTRLAVSLITVPFHIFMAIHYLGFSPSYLWRDGKSALLSVLFMAGIVSLFQYSFASVNTAFPPIVIFIIEILIGVIAYFLSYNIFDREFIHQAVKMSRQAIK
jgi:O-antigen/teichoic acid export membrane protein